MVFFTSNPLQDLDCFQLINNITWIYPSKDLELKSKFDLESV